MLDLTAAVHTFASLEIPSHQGVQFRPIIRRHVTHVSPENIKVKVTFWVRSGAEATPPLATAENTTEVTVTLAKANEMAEKFRTKGWFEAKWG